MKRARSNRRSLEVAKLWNADVDFLLKTQQVVGDFNAIQPWKVNRDGSVQNAIV